MMEAEWLTCTDPKKMLEFLDERVSDRKLRLIATACCRRIWPLLDDKRSRDAVELLDRFSDGLVHETQLAVGAQAAHDAAKQKLSSDHPQAAAAVANALYAECPHPYDEDDRSEDEDEVQPNRKCGTLSNAIDAAFAAAWAMDSIADPAGDDTGAWHKGVMEEERVQCGLIRDIVGNPCQVEYRGSWLTPAVRSLAQAIDDELAFDRMPVLAKALATAGCKDASVLEHSRELGPHVRGCWVVDLILGKK